MRHIIFFIICWLMSGIQTGFCAVSTLLADTQNGVILSSQNASTQQYPASLTKVMTLYLTFNALEKGLLKMDDALPISLHAAKQPASKMYLKAGETIRVRDAINALIIKSANDVAVVLAETLAPSEADFAKMMTETAKKLGMKNTVFRNASGLHHPNQVTTAQDMAVLTIALINHFPQYYKLFAKNEFTYRGKVYKTHNRVTKNYKGAEGLKTGYVAAVGYNIISTAKRSNQRFVTVVIGQKSIAERDKQAIRLLDKGFTMAKSQKSVLKKLQKQGKTLNTNSVKKKPDLKTQFAVMEKRLARIKKISKTAQSIQLAKIKESGQLDDNRSLPTFAALDEIEQQGDNDAAVKNQTAYAKQSDILNVLPEISSSKNQNLPPIPAKKTVITQINETITAENQNPQIQNTPTEIIAQNTKQMPSEQKSLIAAEKSFKTFSAENPVLIPSSTASADQKVVYQAIPAEKLQPFSNPSLIAKSDSTIDTKSAALLTEAEPQLQSDENKENKIPQTALNNSLKPEELKTAVNEILPSPKENIIKATSDSLIEKNTTLLAQAEPNAPHLISAVSTDKTGELNPETKNTPVVEEKTPQNKKVIQTAMAKDTMKMRKASWGVQVGAFSNKTAAEKQANKALHIVSGADKFVKVTQTDKFYRSRIYGFKSKKSANLACRRLKSKKFHCMTLAPTLSLND